MTVWLRAVLRSERPRGVLAGWAIGLGVFGSLSLLARILALLVNPRGSFRVGTVVSLVLSLLLMVTAAELWRATRRGWWLLWAVMLLFAGSGVLAHVTPGLLQPGITPRFLAGFGAIAACTFFLEPLTHVDIYARCFAEGRRPHSLFLAAPFLVGLAGVVIVWPEPAGPVAGGIGLFLLTYGLVNVWLRIRHLRAVESGMLDA